MKRKEKCFIFLEINKIMRNNIIKYAKIKNKKTNKNWIKIKENMNHENKELKITDVIY